MTRDKDLDLNSDPELESRLRTIAGVEPEMPARISRFAAGVAGGRTAGVDDADLMMHRVRRPGLLPRPGRAAFALTALTLVLAVGAAGLVALRPSGRTGAATESATGVATASASYQVPDQWGGLEWLDVTAHAFPASWVTGGGPTSVVYWHGSYYANPATILWSSPDGVRWHQVEGAPGANVIAATDDMLVLDGPGCMTALNYTTDGQTWKAADLPLSAGVQCSLIPSFAATSSAVIVVMLQDLPGGQYAQVPYRSTDGVTWTIPEMPGGSAVVGMLGVTAGRAGFLTAGAVNVKPDGQGYSFDRGFWYSADGLSWQTATLPADAPGLSTIPLQTGSLGDWMEAADRGYHSLDDLTWTTDSMPADFSLETIKLTSDGSRILAQTPGPKFYVSRGDGNWRQLTSGHSTGIVDGGQSWILPDGVLYIADGHVFFGTPTQG
jgi:hypothetical protein